MLYTQIDIKLYDRRILFKYLQQYKLKSLFQAPNKTMQGGAP